jgi:homoserine kinase type II
MTNHSASLLKEILSQHYDLGKLVEYQQLHLGYVNISYVIWTEAAGIREAYFLRRYKVGIKAEEIEFEHSVINHLIEQDFELVARVMPTRDGSTYVERLEADGGGAQRVYYAVFGFLPGEDRYTWISPRCKRGELECSAEVLATFHGAVYDLAPAGRREEPNIVQLMPAIAASVEQWASKAGETVFDACFMEHLDLIRAAIDGARQAITEQAYAGLVHQVIHCDYHPGNLKFQEKQITGLFDFDWSKVEARCFDVAHALFYFTTTWEGDLDGELRLDEVAVFLRAYQETSTEKHPAGPLSEAELAMLPHMIGASNIYVLNWTLADFYCNDVDPVEYRAYLAHSVRLMRWLDHEHNWQKLKEVISALA